MSSNLNRSHIALKLLKKCKKTAISKVWKIIKQLPKYWKKNSCFQLQIQFSPRIIFRTLWSTWSAPKRDTPSSRSEPTAAKQQPGGVIRRRRIATLCVRLEIKKLQSFLVVVLLGLGLFGFEHTHIKPSVVQQQMCRC